MATNVQRTRFEFSALDGVSSVLRNIGGELRSLRTAADTFQNVLGAIGITVGVGAMVKFAADTLKATAALDDMAESTGASVEALSRLQGVARIGGHDMATLTLQMARMVKGLKDGSDEGSASARAFEAMGVKVRDSGGRIRDTGQIVIEASKALGQYADTGEKLQAIQDAMGKGAERLAPFFKDIAQYGDEAGTVFAEQAAQAERLQHEMGRLHLAFDEFRRDILLQALPPLIELIKQFNEARDAAGGFASGLLTLATADTANVTKRLAEINKELEKLVEQNKAAEGVGSWLGGLLGWPAKIGAAGGRVDQGRLLAEKDFLESLQKRRMRDLTTGLVEDPSGNWVAAPSLPRLNYRGGAEDPDIKRQRDAWQKWLAEREQNVRDAIKKEGDARVKEEQRVLDEIEKWNKQKEEDISQIRRQVAEDDERRELEQIARVQQAEEDWLAENKALRERMYEDAIRAEQRVAQEALREMERISDAIADSLANAIMEGGISGRELLKGVFRSALIMPIVQPFANAIAASMMGGLSMLGGPWAGGAQLAQQAGLGALFASFGGGGAMAAGATVEELAGAGLGPGISAAAGMPGWGYLGYAPAAMHLIQGDVKGAAFSAGGAALGSMIMPGVGTVIGGLAGSLLGGALGGGDDAPKMRTAGLAQGFGAQSGAFSGQFLPNEIVPGLSALSQQIGAQEQNIIRNLQLTQQQQAAVSAALAPLSGRQYGFGMEGTDWDWQRSEATQRIIQDRLTAISATLGRSIEELSSVMQLSADQWQSAVDQLESALADAEGNLRDFALDLPEALGITQLEEFQKSLAVSDVLAPMDRLSAARSQYDELLQRAQGGDIEAIRGFPGAAQELLGIGRDVYASGGAFQDLFKEVNTSLNQVLDRQREQQADLMSGLELSIDELRRSWIEELKLTKTAIVKAVDDMRGELRRMTG